LTIQL